MGFGMRWGCSALKMGYYEMKRDERAAERAYEKEKRKRERERVKEEKVKQKEEDNKLKEKIKQEAKEILAAMKADGISYGNYQKALAVKVRDIASKKYSRSNLFKPLS